MRRFYANLAAVPTLPWVSFESKDFSDTAYTSTYTDNTLSGGAITVPASTPFKLQLDHRPKRLTLTVTLNAVAAQLIEAPATPTGAGVVSVNYLTGIIEFHSSDAGKTVVATYKHFGTALDASTWMLFQKALTAAAAVAATYPTPLTLGDTIYGAADTTADILPGNTAAIKKVLSQKGTGAASAVPSWRTLYSVRSLFIPGVPDDTTVTLVGRAKIEDDGTNERRLKRISVFRPPEAGLPASGQTVLRVTTSATSTGGQTITLPVSGAGDATYSQTVTCDVAIDTSSGIGNLNVFCDDNSGEHQNITMELYIE